MVKDALLKFFGVNRCGDSKSWFHPPCHLQDAVTGGWHDCGYHLKEGATMSYTAAVLGLAAAAFSNVDQDLYNADQSKTIITDGIPDILYEAKHGADFVLRSYDLAGGDVSKMITSIGGFGNPGCGDDHMWWGPPELQDQMPSSHGGPPRCARNEPTTDYLAKYAANLAFVSKRIRLYDAAYADKCLKTAIAIYDFTKVNLSITNTSAYNGATIVTDDAAFGCLALLWATGERKYLDELCYDKTNAEVGINGTTNILMPVLGLCASDHKVSNRNIVQQSSQSMPVIHIISNQTDGLLIKSTKPLRTATLYTVSGRVVKQQQASTSQPLSISMQHSMTSGMYLLQVVCTDGSRVMRKVQRTFR